MPPQRRAGRQVGPFVLHPSAPILARVPLLPTDGPVDRVLDEGVFLASRHLHNAADTDRSRQSVRAYELRARWRPTPHGVFAGVALAETTDGPTRLAVGSQHRLRTNPSAAWLAATCAILLSEPPDFELLTSLALTADATAVRRGDRWEVEAQPAAGRGAVERCTVRATLATDVIMTVCADGADTGTVMNAIHSRWPQAPEPMVLATLTDLIRHGFLLTNLLTDPVNDPIGQLLRALSPAHPMREPLTELRTALNAADTHTPGDHDRRQALEASRRLADRMCRVDRPLTVDIAIDAQFAVPAGLVADAVDAAGVLWRITGQRDPASTYHQRFVDRYGHYRYVPLLEAADPVLGIGLPATHEARSEHDPERLAVLSGLIARSYADRAIEVELDDATITALAGQGTPTPPHGTDVYVRLIATDNVAAVRGVLRLVVAGCVPTAGSTLARFASLLGHHHSEPVNGPALIAELAVRPRSISAQTVAPTSGFAEHRIPVGVPGRDDRDLRLTDLHLVSDGTDLSVWSATRNRQVIPVLFSRLAPALLPPIARLLYILGQAGTTPCNPWSWATATSPFQPRIRYRDTILSSARWTFPPALIAAARDADQWETALDRWRADTVPPPSPTVLTEDDDRQLPLTLDHPDDRQLLRRYVRRGLTAVTELPGGPNATSAVAAGPHGRHVTELVIPVCRRTDPPSPRPRATFPARTRGQGLFYPGGPWLSLAIPTEPHLQDELVLRLADLATDLAECWRSWFWLRYRTTALGHHLRARFHGSPDVLGSRVLPAVAAWATAMNEQRLAGRMTVECYDQEIERYGGPAAIECAEAVFAADSQLAVTLLRTDPDDRIMAAARVAATIARTVADADTAALVGRHLDRTARQTMNRLRPGVRDADRHGDRPGRKDLGALLETLVAYRAALPEGRYASCASSLIHMHANRALAHADDEPLIRALAADLIARP